MTTPLDNASHTATAVAPTVLDMLRSNGAGPFLDMPLVQLPPAPQLPPAMALPPMPTMPTLPAIGAMPPAAPAPAIDPHAASAIAIPQLPPMPQLPADPMQALDALMQAGHLPGMDALMQPLTQLLGSFGSGVFGALNPVNLLQQGSQVVDTAMQTGTGALKTLSGLWKSPAAQSAQDSGQKAASNGADVSKQGTTIASITQKAQAEVQQGQAELTAIIQEFAAKAVALAPFIMAPPTLPTLLAFASQAFATGSAVVAKTQGMLGALGADVAAAGGPLAVLANSGINPGEIASQALGQAQPVVSQVSDMASNALGGNSSSAGNSGGLGNLLGGTGDNASTTAAGFDGGLGGLGGGLGGLAGGLGGLGGDFGSGGGIGGLGGAPAAEPMVPPSVGGTPGAPLGAAPVSGPLGAAGATAPGAGNAPVGGMSPAAAGAHGKPGGDQEHHRTIKPYETVDYSSGLDPASPAVLGDNEEAVNAQYETDYKEPTTDNPQYG